MNNTRDMEFATEEEAREYSKAVYGYNSNFGFVQLGKEPDSRSAEIDAYVDYLNKQDTEGKACYVVMAEWQGRRIYAKKRGISYIQSEAHLYTKDKAQQRAKYMTKNGTYQWFIQKVL